MDRPDRLQRVEPSQSNRVPPRERFAPDAIQFDLRMAAVQLDAEPDTGQFGHRQVALYKYEKATIALFRFEKGGSMQTHKAPGTVFIQVIEGKMTLDVSGTKHHLEAGGMLVLAPGIQHDVQAEERSLMLLTICLGHEAR